MLYTAKITKVDHFFWAGDEYLHYVDKYAGEDEIFKRADTFEKALSKAFKEIFYDLRFKKEYVELQTKESSTSCIKLNMHIFINNTDGKGLIKAGQDVTDEDRKISCTNEYIMHVVVNKYADAPFNEEDLAGIH